MVVWGFDQASPTSLLGRRRPAFPPLLAVVLTVDLPSPLDARGRTDLSRCSPSDLLRLSSLAVDMISLAADLLRLSPLAADLVFFFFFCRTDLSHLSPLAANLISLTASPLAARHRSGLLLHLHLHQLIWINL
ncbi:hypothetical protein LWI29_017092 [Acer saccharum]|uniref:Uncharacterized protein n=1 Tax=Acer saccharum TaxID=4024 RepID=A0AA39T3V8_ACESA|nr:hypothetical protein LWI29_017092 [Acer saccharum]